MHELESIPIITKKQSKVKIFEFQGSAVEQTPKTIPKIRKSKVKLSSERSIKIDQPQSAFFELQRYESMLRKHTEKQPR